MGDEHEDLPSFIIIGAMKCGTTSLRSYLGAHPQIFIPFLDRGLSGFFTTARNHRQLHRYRRRFASADGAFARGDGSASYAAAPHIPGVAARIHDLVPDAKLIYVVRDPIARAQSQYAYEVRGGWERRPLVEAVHEGSRFVDPSRYAYQLLQYLEHFPREQLLVLASSDLRNNRTDALRRVCKFIGVDPGVAIPGTDREFNATEEFRAVRPWAEAVRRVVVPLTPLRLLPRQVKIRLYRPTLTSLPTPDTTLPVDLERRLWDLFAADLEELGKISDVRLELGPRP